MKSQFMASLLRRWSVVPLRVIVGSGLVVHGDAKIVNGPDRFAMSLHALGVPAPSLMAWTTIVVELAGCVAVLVGAYVVVVSVPLAAILLVAAIAVHLRFGFSSIKLRAVTAAGPQFGPPGYEINLLYLAGLATLALGGCGPYSVDQLRARSVEHGNDAKHRPSRVLTDPPARVRDNLSRHRRR